MKKVSYGPVAGNTSLEQDARLRIADCQFMLKQYKLARAGYQRVVDLDLSTAPYALFQLAAVSGVTSSNEKISLLQQLLEKYPASNMQQRPRWLWRILTWRRSDSERQFLC